jgi:leucyl aminopeptidase (aminopeptidase T)
MTEKLTAAELVALIRRVFMPAAKDKRLAILVDLPDDVARDHDTWRARREMAAEWAALLDRSRAELALDAVDLVLYANVHSHNANLPATASYHRGGPIPSHAHALRGEMSAFDSVFESHQLFVAPTEFSATAPLKLAAPVHAFRAATMPGFSAAMIPALRLDYEVIGRKVARFKRMLDDATRCDIRFRAGERLHELTLDLRHRRAHESGGMFPHAGAAGNLPSGEAYIVPYEGEIPGDPSGSRGEIPVQLGDDVVVYRVERNVAVEVVSDNPTSRIEAEHIRTEPALGNLAELGLGVLGDFGIVPIGELLLDEKLGLHIAFGRSDHFGGQVGPSRFSAPDKVEHIDRVYIPALQPRVTIERAELTMADGGTMLLMRDGAYAVDR